MPFINSKVNIKLTNEQKDTLKQKLGKAIEIIPGKTESRLMLDFEENCCLYFKGKNDSKLAFIEVKVFGKSDKDSFNKLTGEICTIFNDVIGIEKDKIYVKYEEADYWGCDGFNF